MDLAQGIVELGRVAEGRRAARRELIEATDRVADAIRTQLRAGDQVQIGFDWRKDKDGSHYASGGGLVPTYRVARVTWHVSQWANDVNAILHPKGDQALLRGSAVLGNVRESYWDGHNDHHVVGHTVWSWETTNAVDFGVESEEPDLHLATAEERAAFAVEAPEVVRLFRETLEKQARDYEGAADAVAKTVIR